MWDESHPKLDDSRPFTPLGMAVLTISDTRTLDDDRSGACLIEALTAAGHRLVDRRIVRDEEEAIADALREWLARADVQVILTTGGTGITRRDVTPEVVSRFLDKPIPGFGELFRMLSYRKIGPATIQSRALAGIARGRLIFALPGSPGACRDAWEGILRWQLDSRCRPCNFVELLPRLV